MNQVNRLAGGQIDRSQTLKFKFDGKNLEGHPGDTLASALLANDVRLMGRSFKYHRPRGVLTAGSEEPNAIVELREGARQEPNTRATTAELFEGLTAKSQNKIGSLKFDLMAFQIFLQRGFITKLLCGPPHFGKNSMSRSLERQQVWEVSASKMIPIATTVVFYTATF